MHRLAKLEQVSLDQEKDVRAPLHETLLGSHPRIVEVRDLIERLASVNLTVLITGETGTGKDVAARMLHKLSPRQGKPFIKVNCPSIPEALLESELFGYERGAFTGAHRAKPGRFELAHEGTIFLDEICETSQTLQGKLLQVLDDQSFLRIGGVDAIITDARVVAATNVPLEAAVNEGRLRKDISFRLSEVVVHLPPLREHPGDIPLLAEHFNFNMCKMLKRPYAPLKKNLLEQLQQLTWQGNVRELAARVKKYVATGSEADLLDAENSIGNGAGAPVAAQAALKQANGGNGKGERQFIPLREAARRAVETAERALIEETLRYTLWNRRKAAKLLDTSYSSLLRRIDAYKIGQSGATM